MHHDPIITFADLIPGLNHLPAYVANAILIALIIVALVLVGTAKLRKGTPEDHLIPDGKFSLQNLLESIVEVILKLISDTLGAEVARDFLFIIGASVFFILFSNLAGLVPGMNPPTDNLNTTAACALTVFGLTHYFGWKEHGAKYLRQFTGPFLWLSPLMIPIEIIGHLARPMSLSLRLFGNIMGDHLVAAIFIMLAPLLVPIPIAFLGLFVAFVQTFVFILLSMAYFSGAISHDH
ncbi:MAG: F0F1 ATP synthase subunit A [Deltaproteobacteria bacterium]|nr:F0F1 ATP synthase subunit A [Candidatus Anaeroferrophillus wilburensis]MBN2889205.1 F0F1 ATP synthase subunit A [Deltaproteobacteria bacterium]